ncbi:protein PFC0760c [Nilaparvata lugens]|uniref:protein PFC0760c n=1 Tax=Nilaparvata lugens TaxID=108931 RepID=UPI00193DFAFD|nr:protein PFC0760c [Nilaparvata lugens]
MTNKPKRLENSTFAFLNFYSLILIFAIITKICTGVTLDEETITSLIHKESGLQSIDSASNHDLEQVDSTDGSLTHEHPANLIDSLEYANSDQMENDKFNTYLSEQTGNGSSTWNLVNKQSKPSRSEEGEDYCNSQNETGKKKVINISATTSTVTKISIIMDGDDEEEDDDGDDGCTPEISSYTTKATTKKCSVCTSKTKEGCNKENGGEKANDEYLEKAPTKFVCTVTTEEIQQDDDKDNSDDTLNEVQEELNDEDDHFQPATTRPISSTERLRQKRNYFKKYNSYKNEMENQMGYTSDNFKNRNAQEISKEEKIMKIQALLQDIQRKLGAHSYRQMNELRIVKKKMEDFEKNNLEKSESNTEIDDDLLDKLRKALIKQYENENKFANNDGWEFKNFEIGQEKNMGDDFENIQHSLKYPYDSQQDNLVNEFDYNGIWLGKSNLQNDNSWSNIDRIADYKNKLKEGRRNFNFNKQETDFLISTNLDGKHFNSNLAKVNSENLKRSINCSQKVFNEISKEMNENEAAQENSSPVYISQIYLIDSNESDAKLNNQ